MKCKEARERWHAVLDENVHDAELTEHLSACESCREYDAQMRRIVGALDDLRVESETEVVSGESPPGGAWPRPALRFRLFARRGLFRAAAVIALMVLGGLYFGDRLRPQRPASLSLSTPREPERFSASLRLTGDSAERYVAVSVPTSQVDVQMFWLYPTLASVTGTDR